MKSLKHLLYLTAVIFIFFACGKKQETVDQKSNFIEITNKQFAVDSMQLGKVEIVSFESIVKCNGTFVALPNGLAKVNAPINGVIKSINCHSGQLVQKNQLLIEITGNEIIDTQKDFAEASANFSRMKNEYERVKTLYTEKVISEKDYVLAESDYKTSMAKYNGLKLKIEAIGLSASNIENGKFNASYAIRSPINGYISNLNANIGSYVEPQTELLEIINPAMFQIKLSVFASDISSLKIGQTVRFKSVNTEDYNVAKITSIGVAIDNMTKSIECYAALTSKKPTNPIANQFIECEIITNVHMASGVPSDAIIKTETANVVLVLEKQESELYYFNKVEVNVGKQQNGFSELLDNIIDGLIITKGVYNITLN